MMLDCGKSGASMTARATDPATSHLAATYIAGKRPGLKDAFLMALKALGPSTANEIAQWCVQSGVTANAESVRKRAIELVRDGLCEWSEARACKVTKLQARTVRVANENQDRDGREDSEANRPSSTSDSGRSRKSDSNSGKVQDQQVASVRNQTAAKVSTPEADRIAAVAEYVRHEREWIDNWRVGQAMSIAARTLGTWPMGTAEEYILACDLASAQGLIEREGQKVRAKRVERELKAVQKGLFE
jgi:hypothetical protein